MGHEMTSSRALEGFKTKHLKMLLNLRDLVMELSPSEISSATDQGILEVMKSYPNVLYTDVDTVWLADPRPFLAGEYDVWTSRAKIQGFWIMEGE